MLKYRAIKFLARTGYTVCEFQALLPYFQARFARHMAATTRRGKPRTRRRYSTYQNAQLPRIEDQLLFILVYLKHGASPRDLVGDAPTRCQPRDPSVASAAQSSPG